MSRHFIRGLRMIPVVRRSCFSTEPQLRNYWRRSVWSDPFPELTSTIRNMDRQMRDFDREIRRMFDGFDRVSPIVRFPRVPWNGEAETPSLRSGGIEVAKDGTRRFKLQIDASQFKPEEVKLSIKDGSLCVNAKREEQTGDGGRIFEEFTRQYKLPDELNAQDVRCAFSPDGILSIEAPLPAIEPPKEREIPISVESDKKQSTQ